METKYFQLAKRVDLLLNTIKMNLFAPLEVGTIKLNEHMLSYYFGKLVGRTALY